MTLGKEKIKELLVAQWLTNQFKDLAKELITSPEDIQTLYLLNKDKDAKIAWRSAYLLDLCHDEDPTILNEYLEDIIRQIPNLQNDSIKRHYCRIISQHDLKDLADGYLIDTLFTWLQILETPIAVKAHCMQILFDLTLHYPDLVPELKTVLENLLPYGSKGEINRAKRILKELNNQ
jgi:hypothetical protein